MAQVGDTSGVLSGDTSGSRLLTAYETVGGRQRLTVKLKPNETTIVSWKKLLKDAATGNASLTSSRKPNKKPIAGPGPDQSSGSTEQPLALPPPPQPSVNTHLSPGPVQENEAKDVPPTSRLSTVIERIERLYASKASSDEEELNDIVPDDDDYDTEDSFIDDTELDEYFQVDNSAIKHDGFFINRGKLERAGEASAQQTKKRRRKDDTSVVKSSNKHLKLGKKDGRSSLQSNGKSSVIAQNVKTHTQKKKSTATRITLEPIASPSGVLIVHKKNIDQPKLALPSKDNANKSKENSDPSNDKLDDKRGSLNNFNELLGSSQQKEKSGPHERLEITVPQGNNTPHVAKVTPAKKREGSSSKSKNTMLERAIKDLEKLVSESRPASVEVQESDTNNTPQAVKRRLPPEVKQKLAKVARLAQASHGKITKELLDRLMSIVGHMIKIRSLKKNLETMVSIGLSAKQENANKIQQVKKEVAEMVRARIATNSKEVEQQVGGDDFEESKNDEKVFLKKKHGMDDALEDKICQLYDLHNEEVDDDTRPQGKKLYEEMAGLWPSGLMNGHGIKRGICRARNRRRALQSQHKDDEKTKRKVGSSASSSSKSGTGTGEEQHVVPVVQAQDKVVLASILSSASAAAADASLRMAVSLMKQEKVKGSSVSASADTKKVKRKAEDGGMTQAQGGQRKKSHKQQVPVVAAVSLPETTTTTETAAPVDVTLPKSNLETAAPS